MFVSDILDEVIEILGRCDRVKALKRITEAVKALQDEGDWNANIGALDIRTFANGNIVTLPREVETPLAVAIAGVPAFMRDEFYRFHINGEGLLNEENVVGWAWDDVGQVPCFMDIVNPGPLVALSDLFSDAGKRIRVLGKDSTGKQLRQQLEDGSWVEGIVLELAHQTGLPSSEPTSVVRKRIFRPAPSTLLLSATAHKLVTGQLVQSELVTGAMPDPLVEGGRYYVRSVGEQSVSLHETRLQSQTGQNPVLIHSSDPTTELMLTDRRNVTPITDLEITLGNEIDDLDLVKFTTSLEPIDIAKQYVARVSSATRFSIYGNREDAEKEANAVNVVASGTIIARILKECSPLTVLNFNGVRHNLATGDSVTLENSSGSLPQPLLPSTAYYVFKRSDYSITIHSTYTDSLTGANPIVLTSEGAGTNSVVKLLPATAAIGNSGNIRTTLAHNLNSPQGSGGWATAYFTAGSVTSVVVNAAGSGYEAAPFISFGEPGPGGTKASGYAVVANGQITSIVIVEAGTGYPGTYRTVWITPAGGSFVRFVSDGNMPAPLAQGAVYRAEAPLTANSFTVHDLTPEKISLTTTGSGNLFLVISRAFSVGYLPQFVTDATDLVTGNAIKFVSEGLYPTASPAINGTDDFYIRKISGENLIEVYASEGEATNLASTTGRISVIARGSSTLYAATTREVSPAIKQNALLPEFAGFLGTDAAAKFETTDTLPSPLNTADTYLVSVVDGVLTIKASDESPIVLTDVGTGTHTMVIAPVLDPEEITSLAIPNQQYATGDLVRFETTDTLPDPLAPDTDYYLRPIEENAVEVYPTANDAETANLSARIAILSKGEGVQRVLKETEPEQVAEVAVIEKQLTDSYARLYCWDATQTNNIVLLGDFHPTEQQPSYRRIRVAKSTDWVRMKYRRRATDLLSERDFINLDSKMAILMMVQSHELLLKKFAEESDRYRKIAVDHLNRRNRALDGPRSISIQINADIMGNPSDVMV